MPYIRGPFSSAVGSAIVNNDVVVYSPVTAMEMVPTPLVVAIPFPPRVPEDVSTTSPPGDTVTACRNTIRPHYVNTVTAEAGIGTLIGAP